MLENQKAGKKKMWQFGKVEIPQEGIAALKMDAGGIVDRKLIKSLLDQPIPVRKGPSLPQDDFSRHVLRVPSVEIIFRSHKRKLKDFISRYDVLLGAVAWLTDEDIIYELSKKRTSMLVQKEDFLRPDSRGSKDSLRKSYSSLSTHLSFAEIPGILNRVQYSESCNIQPIRCVGNANSKKKSAFPRMHNKFLIGCDYSMQVGEVEHAEHNFVIPRAVWTGSYNFSYNARASFENAIITTDDRVARAFAEEWSQIYLLSEELNWSDDWVAPDYWIGT